MKNENKTFTQEEVDTIVKERIRRERFKVTNQHIKDIAAIISSLETVLDMLKHQRIKWENSD